MDKVDIEFNEMVGIMETVEDVRQEDEEHVEEQVEQPDKISIGEFLIGLLFRCLGKTEEDPDTDLPNCISKTWM